MVDVVGSLGEIIRLALRINEAASTVRQNREDCLLIQQRVRWLHDMLTTDGTGMEMIANPAVRAALEDLQGTLHRALRLVTNCQERSTISHCFTAGRLSGKLARVQQDITNQLLNINFATSVLLTITLTRHIRRDDRVRHTPSTPPVPGLWPFWQRINGDHQTPPHTADVGFSGHSDSIHLVVEMKASESSRASGVTEFTWSELLAVTNGFSREQVIHEGDCVTVFKGVLPDGSEVAVKRSHDKNGLLFPMHLQHQNVVRALGHCCYDQGEMVVEEYMPKGTLSERINERSQRLDWSFTFQTVRGIAEGVAYLETMRVVHPNLKPANIFFDYAMNPKIGGFGRSILMLEQGITQMKTEELLGTVGNIPPEYITDGIVSLKSNVFSFGVLLLRIISGMRGPVLNQHPISWALEEWEARQMESFDPSPPDESELKERRRCIGIGLLCTQMDPRDRPDMPEVLEMLKSNEELPALEISGFPGTRSAEQPWWRCSWWNWRSDGRNWSLLEDTLSLHQT